MSTGMLFKIVLESSHIHVEVTASTLHFPNFGKSTEQPQAFNLPIL